MPTCDWSGLVSGGHAALPRTENKRGKNDDISQGYWVLIPTSFIILKPRITEMFDTFVATRRVQQIIILRQFPRAQGPAPAAVWPSREASSPQPEKTIKISILPILKKLSMPKPDLFSKWASRPGGGLESDASCESWLLVTLSLPEITGSWLWRSSATLAI